jgi:hypothetical protein
VRELQHVLPLRLAGQHGLLLLLLDGWCARGRAVEPVLEAPLAERARVEFVVQALGEGGERGGAGEGGGGDAAGGGAAGGGGVAGEEDSARRLG